MTSERGRRLPAVDGLFSARSPKEIKQYLITSWAHIKAQIPEDYNPHYVGFLRDYFRAQLRIQQGRKTKAQRIFDGLDRRTGYKEFEQENQAWLAAIDLAVRGENRRRVEPAFRVIS